MAKGRASPGSTLRRCPRGLPFCEGAMVYIHPFSASVCKLLPSWKWALSLLWLQVEHRECCLWRMRPGCGGHPHTPSAPF